MSLPVQCTPCQVVRCIVAMHAHAFFLVTAAHTGFYISVVVMRMKQCTGAAPVAHAQLPGYSW